MEPISLVAQAVPGIIKGIGSLFGGRKRRREERRARGQYNRQMSAFQNFQFDNAFENLTNPYEDVENELEDLRIATQASEFEAQQQQQGLAQTLDALRGAGGGTGAAAIAQALAQQQSRNQQQIAARIEEQEIANERLAAQNAQQLSLTRAGADMNIQQAQAQGAMAVQDREFDRTSTLLGMAQQRYATAQQARAQATADLGGMFGSVATLGAGKLLGVFGDGK
jgi:chromosome segregation ATPase